jgi:hypothetical protein
MRRLTSVTILILAHKGAGIGAISGYLIGRSGSKKELIYQAR